MEMKIQAQIVGVKKYKGKPDENGPEYDQTKLIVLTPMDNTSGNSLGDTAAEYRFGDSNNFSLFVGMKLPVMAELTVTITSNGKSQKLNVTAVRPFVEQKDGK
ncbi:hypothetical protein QEO94_01230 [Kingella negevensis]|uniref:hypothetical protein n=1 Tax=Kingella negevensis TaxID=1522312 RepID=UPI002542D14B|nr:hypothetical protein [Kingella negevensis]WII93502.1 hypothetical protein QEO94_01230 [Kingella negevensis]